MLPTILERLTASSEANCVDAAVVLSGYALGLLSHSMPREDVKAKLREEVRNFMTRELPGSKDANPGVTHPFPAHLSRALTEDESRHDGRGTRWAVSVLCSLVVLSGYDVFVGTRFFKIVLDTLQQLSRSKLEISQALLACVWKAVIRSFAQIPRGDISSVTAQTITSKHRISLPSKQAVFEIVKQELRHGVGACLVATLLHPPSGRNPSRFTPVSSGDRAKAIVVLGEMVNHPSGKVYQEGVSILARLVSAIGDPKSAAASAFNHWTPDDVPIKLIFSRDTLSPEAHNFSDALYQANRFDPLAIQPFSEEHIQRHWNALLAVWKTCVQREMKRPDYTSLSVSRPNLYVNNLSLNWWTKSVVSQVWQALLLSQTELTQERRHLTTSPPFVDIVVSTIASNLNWISSPPEDIAIPNASIQICVLDLCSQLWNVAGHVFSKSWLASAAGTLLARVLEHTFDLSNEDVKASWSELCAVLISACAPEFISRLVGEGDDQRTDDIRRELWRLRAREWQSTSPQPSVAECVKFLAIPLRYDAVLHLFVRI